MITTYTVYPGKNYSEPRISGSCGTVYEFDFILNDDWDQLYLIANNDTHKLSGVTDLFGLNSLRLGLRRHPNKVNGLVAVAYTHIKGKTGYPALKDNKSDKPLILYYLQEYKCRIFQDGSYWTIEIYSGGVLLSTQSIRMSITLGRKLSAIYVEIDGKPSPYEFTTYLNIIRH